MTAGTRAGDAKYNPRAAQLPTTRSGLYATRVGGTWGAAGFTCYWGMTDNLSSRSPQAPDWEALARYHAGESPAEEARLVATWLAANAQDAALLAMLDDVVERAIGAEHAAIDLPATSPHLDVEAALRAVKARRD